MLTWRRMIRQRMSTHGSRLRLSAAYSSHFWTRYSAMEADDTVRRQFLRSLRMWRN